MKDSYKPTMFFVLATTFVVAYISFNDGANNGFTEKDTGFPGFQKTTLSNSRQVKDKLLEKYTVLNAQALPETGKTQSREKIIYIDMDEVEIPPISDAEYNLMHLENPELFNLETNNSIEENPLIIEINMDDPQYKYELSRDAARYEPEEQENSYSKNEEAQISTKQVVYINMDDPDYQFELKNDYKPYLDPGEWPGSDPDVSPRNNY